MQGTVETGLLSRQVAPRDSVRAGETSQGLRGKSKGKQGSGRVLNS